MSMTHIKHVAPGGADEKVALQGIILNPHACSVAKSAQNELLKWKEAIRRSAELGCQSPDILLVYRAMESIFSPVFDKAEPLLQARWVNLRNELGLPHIPLRVLRKSTSSPKPSLAPWFYMAVMDRIQDFPSQRISGKDKFNSRTMRKREWRRFAKPHQTKNLRQKRQLQFQRSPPSQG